MRMRYENSSRGYEIRVGIWFTELLIVNVLIFTVSYSDVHDDCFITTLHILSLDLLEVYTFLYIVRMTRGKL